MYWFCASCVYQLVNYRACWVTCCVKRWSQSGQRATKRVFWCAEAITWSQRSDSASAGATQSNESRCEPVQSHSQQHESCWCLRLAACYNGLFGCVTRRPFQERYLVVCSFCSMHKMCVLCKHMCLIINMTWPTWLYLVGRRPHTTSFIQFCFMTPLPSSSDCIWNLLSIVSTYLSPDLFRCFLVSLSLQPFLV